MIKFQKGTKISKSIEKIFDTCQNKPTSYATTQCVKSETTGNIAYFKKFEHSFHCLRELQFYDTIEAELDVKSCFNKILTKVKINDLISVGNECLQKYMKLM